MFHRVYWKQLDLSHLLKGIRDGEIHQPETLIRDNTPQSSIQLKPAPILEIRLHNLRTVTPSGCPVMDFVFQEDVDQPYPATRHLDPHGKKRFLLVENYWDFQILICMYFSAIGQPYDLVETGYDAVEILKANPGRYSCIFMNLQGPFMDGHKATRLIREFESTQPHLRRCTIVLMDTPREFRRTAIEHVIELGADFVVQRPLHWTSLIELFFGDDETNVFTAHGTLEKDEIIRFEAGGKAEIESDAAMSLLDDRCPYELAVKEELVRRIGADDENLRSGVDVRILFQNGKKAKIRS